MKNRPAREEMTRKVILDQLDACAREFTFPMLDNGYIYPVDQRMHIMRSDTMWMILIEAVGFNPRAGGIDGIQNCLHLFGSDLHRQPGTANEDFLNPFDYHQEKVFDEEYLWEVNPHLEHIIIRGQRVPVDLRPEQLTAKGIALIEPPKIDPPALLRSLVPEYRNLLLATPDELAQRNPHGIPRCLVLEEWNHPDVRGEQLPSQSETFQMLASVIETGRLDEYRPSLPPNTHWSNWPEGGTL
jgi:hypothetical protein